MSNYMQNYEKWLNSPALSVGLCVGNLIYLEALKNDKKFLRRIKKSESFSEGFTNTNKTA